jgi:hypothetical protein
MVNDPNALTDVAAYTSALKNNSHVFAWSWGDEFGSTVTATTVKNIRDTVIANDPNHLNFNNWYGYSPFTDLQHFFLHYQLADVNAYDVYPYINYCSADSSHVTITNWTAELDLWQLANGTKYGCGSDGSLMCSTTPWSTFVEIGLQQHASGACTGQSTGPTAAQTAMEAWLAVIHGMKAVYWWGPSGWTVEDASRYAGMAGFTIKINTLTNQILGTPVSVTSNQTTAGSRVDVMARYDGTDIWVFAQRLTDDIQDATEATAPALVTQFTVSGISGVQPVIVYGENRTLSSSNGVFSDSFSPYSTHIYRISQVGTAPPTGLTIVIN